MPITWMVDDDADITQAMERMMRLLGYTLLGFSNAGKAGMAILKGERPDLILIDVNMPEVSGLELLSFIRSRVSWNNVPAIMVSAETADVAVDEALRRGADAYLFKPSTLGEVKKAVAEAIEKRQKPSVLPLG
jgi:DNA-binding response OmpR family regulator